MFRFPNIGNIRQVPLGIGKIYIVVLLGAVFFAAAAHSLYQINRERDALALMTRSSIWLTHQLEVEILRFRNALDGFRAGLPDDTADEVRFRFDILWSRVPVAMNGREGAEFRGAPGAVGALQSLRLDLAAFDPVIQKVEKASAAELARISRTVADHSGAIHAVSLELNVGSMSQGVRFEIAERQRETASALTVLIGLGGLIVVLLLVAAHGSRRAAGRERALRQQAEYANDAKSNFLAHMSHELRTPLNAILGFSEIIRQQMFGSLGHPKYSEYAEDIHRAGRHLLNVISDILDLTRIEAGKLRLDEADFDLGGAVGVCVEMIAGVGEVAAAPVRTEIPEGLPMLRADERLVRQLVLNLLSNARKFTPTDGTITVAVAVERDGALSLTVSDTGVGIAREDIARVLEPFGQVETAFAKSHEGVGLGLTLCRQFAVVHGAELTLDSEPGEGTRVAVRFPADMSIVSRGAGAPVRAAA